MSSSAQVRVEGFDIAALTEDVRNFIDSDLKLAAQRRNFQPRKAQKK